MVKDAHVNQGQSSRDPFGDQLVGVGLIFYAARLLMKEHARGRSLLDRQLQYFAGIDACTVDRSAEELDVFDDPVTLIDQDDAEDFMIEMPQQIGRGRWMERV